MLRPLEVVMALLAAGSFAVIAGVGQWLVLGLGLAIVASRFVGFRYSSTREQHRLLLGIVGVPFAALSLMLFLQGSGGTAAVAVNTAQRVAVIGSIYLMLVAALEVYRRPGQARPEIFHVAVLMVMMVAGLTYRNHYYPQTLAAFTLAGVLLLRSPYSGLRPPSHSTRVRVDVGVLLAFGLAMLFAQWFSDRLPSLASSVLRNAFSDIDVMRPDVKVFTVSSDMGTVRRAWRSQALLARVMTPEAGRLRGQVMVTYFNNLWTAPQEKELRRNLTPTRGVFEWRPSAGRSWTIYPVKATQGILPVPGGAWRVRGDMPFLEVDPYDGVFGDTLEPYQVMTDDRLQGPTDGCLQVPPSLQAPLAERAARLLGDERDPLREARAVEGWLSDHGVYDATARRTEGAEPLLDFLDTGLRGYCEYFASSMALLLRVRGIPTRYVIGFTLREKNPLGGYWLVRDCDAHAWVEAYVEGRWQTFDPTPPAHLQARTPDPISGVLDGGKLAILRLFAWLQELPWAHVVAALATLVTVPLGGWWGWRRWQSWRQPAPSPLEKRRREAELRWARQGLVRRPEETWWEFCARGEGVVEREWVEEYCRERYSGI